MMRVQVLAVREGGLQAFGDASAFCDFFNLLSLCVSIEGLPLEAGFAEATTAKATKADPSPSARDDN